MLTQKELFIVYAYPGKCQNDINGIVFDLSL